MARTPRTNALEDKQCDRLFSGQDLQVIRAAADGILRRHSPPLAPRDIAGLLLEGVMAHLRIRHAPRIVRWEDSHADEFYEPAFNAVLQASPETLERGGFIPAVWCSSVEFSKFAEQRWLSWIEEAAEIRSRAKARLSIPTWGSRDGRCLVLWFLLRRQEILSRQEQQLAVSSLMWAFRSADVREGDLDHETRAELLLLLGERKVCFYRGADGRVRVGPRQFEDHLEKRNNAEDRGPDRLVRSTTDLGVTHEGANAFLGEKGATAKEQEAVLAAMDAVDARRVLAEVSGELQAQGRMGRARRQVLENAQALASGEISLTDLHRMTGLDLGGLTRAWAQVRSELAKAPRLRRLRPSG